MLATLITRNDIYSIFSSEVKLNGNRSASFDLTKRKKLKGGKEGREWGRNERKGENYSHIRISNNKDGKVVCKQHGIFWRVFVFLTDAEVDEYSTLGTQHLKCEEGTHYLILLSYKVRFYIGKHILPTLKFTTKY